MGRIEISDRDRKQAFALFDQDESIGMVATKLFAGHWYKAKKLREEYDASPAEEEGGSPEPEAEALTEERQLVAAEPELVVGERDETPAAWDVTLQVPVHRMDAIIAQFSPQEKADAICAVLQARLNAEG